MQGPQRIDSSRRLPLHGTAAARAIEQRALAATEPHALMQRAGIGVARLARAIAPHARRVAVLAGPGNNGGDGLVAAAVLHRCGVAVRVHLLSGPRPPTGDAAWALQTAQQTGVDISTDLPTPTDGSALWIDALLGLGSGRALEGALREAALASHACTGPVLAVDLPSGLHPDSGHAEGAVVRATHTLSLLTLKPGLFTANGRDASGEIWFDDLGVNADDISADAWLVERPASAQALAPRPHASHKGRFGDLVVVGGAAGMAGAAQLAASAALAAGAGRVYISALSDEPPPTQRPELMSRPPWWQAEPTQIAAALLVCGCGGGNGMAAVLPPLLHHARRAVFDADALNAIAGDGALQRQLRQRARRGAATVLTPHPLEAARLLGSSTAAVQADRLAAALELADRLQAVVLLKGSGSVIVAPGGVPWVNSSGNGRLATPGSGDVLAGWIGGAWCGHDGIDRQTLQQLVAGCCWLHGHAADASGAGDPARLPLLAADQITRMVAPWTR